VCPMGQRAGEVGGEVGGGDHAHLLVQVGPTI
jgi:hypothetical protein